MVTGKNCTKTKLHEGTKLHENKFARGNKIALRHFAKRVNFARVTISHGGSFLLQSKKTKKN